MTGANGSKQSTDEAESHLMQKRWLEFRMFLGEIEEKSKTELGPMTRNVVDEINGELSTYVERIEKTERKLGKDERESEDISDMDREEKTYRKRTGERDMIKLMEKMDNRIVPKLEAYDEESGLGLLQYLERFEQYCGDNYRGGTYLWINELEQHLTGRTREGLRAIKQADDSYETVKEKLVGWYEDEGEIRKMRSRKTFDNVKMKKGESMLMYCNRILSLFKLGYPKKNSKNSKLLVDKFTTTIPREAQQAVTNLALSHRLNNQKIEWVTIQKYARIYDIEVGAGKDTDKEDEDDDVVVINFAESKNLKGNEEQSRAFGPGRQRFGVEYNQNYDKCRYCGRFGHREEECRRKMRTCFRCGKGGHRAENCYSNRNENLERSEHSSRNNNSKRNYYFNRTDHVNRNEYSNYNDQSKRNEYSNDHTKFNMKRRYDYHGGNQQGSPRRNYDEHRNDKNQNLLN